MEIVSGVPYDHKKEDCPYVLSLALQKKYGNIPKLGCMLEDAVLMKKLKGGLKKHKHTLNQIHHSTKEFIDNKETAKLLKYLLKNKKDGFMVLEHNNPKETRHLFAFLFNFKHNTLDFFDSYNDTRTFYTLRMKRSKVTQFIKEVFDKYFKKEFLIEKIFEFNPL